MANNQNHESNINKQSLRVIFISWTKFNPHSSLLNSAFRGDIYYINNLINTRGIIWKIFFGIDYLYKSIKTITIIIKNRPHLVVVQNPPSIAPIIIVLFSYLRRYKTILDSHNGAFEKPWSSIPLYKWSLRNSDTVIVHNDQIYKRLVQDRKYRKVNFKVLNSRLSHFENVKKENPIENPYILVVSTFSADEPMEIILEGLRIYLRNNLSNVMFKITGNYNKKRSLFNEYEKDNKIEFLGFVSNERYRSLMVNSSGIISISSREDVQQFALMESIGAGIPFISNKNITNLSLFGEKMILVEIKPEGIAQGIDDFLRNKTELEKYVLKLKSRLHSKWEEDFSLIKSELSV